MRAMARASSPDDAALSPALPNDIVAEELPYSVLKVIALPARRMILGHAGCLGPFAQWQRKVESSACDIDGLARLGPIFWRRLPIYARSPLVVVALGWSDAQDKVTGYVFNSEDGFAPRLIGDGHTVTPEPLPDDIGYEAIYDRWVPATRGEDTVKFHELVARSQTRCSRLGLYPSWSKIGGELMTATVSRDAAEVRTVCRL